MKIFPKNIANFNIFSPVTEKNNLDYFTRTIFRARLVKSVCFQMGYIGLPLRHSEVTFIKKIAELQRKDVFGERRGLAQGLLCCDTIGIMLGGFSVLTKHLHTRLAFLKVNS